MRARLLKTSQKDKRHLAFQLYLEKTPGPRNFQQCQCRQESLFASVPLTSKHGHNIGAICVVDPNEKITIGYLRLKSNAVLIQRDHVRTHSNWLGKAVSTTECLTCKEEPAVFLEPRSLPAQLLEGFPRPSRAQIVREEEQCESDKGK